MLTRSFRRSSIWLPLACSLLLTMARAQDASTGAIRGAIADQSGARISAAEVVLVNTATGIREGVTSNSEGAFVFNLLPPGQYSLRITAPGMAPQLHTGLRVEVGGALRLDLHLSVAGAQESVTFPRLQRWLRPRAARCLQSLMSALLSAPSTTAPNWDAPGGAVVNVVTKSGTNHMHGGAFYFLRDSGFNARPHFLDFKPSDRQHQLGFTLGGPLRRNRAFFYAGFDQHIFHVPSVVQFVNGASTIVPQAVATRLSRRITSPAIRT